MEEPFARTYCANCATDNQPPPAPRCAIRAAAAERGTCSSFTAIGEGAWPPAERCEATIDLFSEEA